MAAITDAQRAMMGRVLGHGFRNNFVLRNGSRGTTVRALQLFLKDNGADISADGVFGPQTRAALQDYQKTAGVNVDGVAGSKTFKSIQSKVGAATVTPAPQPAPIAGLQTAADLVKPPLPRPRPAPDVLGTGVSYPNGIPRPNLPPPLDALGSGKTYPGGVALPNARPVMPGGPTLAGALAGPPAAPPPMPMPPAGPAGAPGGDTLSSALAPPPAPVPPTPSGPPPLDLTPFGASGWRNAAAINSVNQRMQPEGPLAPPPTHDVPSPLIPPVGGVSGDLTAQAPAAHSQVAGDVQWYQNHLQQQGADPATIQQKTDAFRKLAMLHAMGPDMASQGRPIPASATASPAPPAPATPSFGPPASWSPAAPAPLQSALDKAAAAERQRLQELQQMLQGGQGPQPLVPPVGGVQGDTTVQPQGQDNQFGTLDSLIQNLLGGIKKPIPLPPPRPTQPMQAPPQLYGGVI